MPAIAVLSVPSDGFSADTISVGDTAIPICPSGPSPAQQHRSPATGLPTAVAPAQFTYDMTTGPCEPGGIPGPPHFPPGSGSPA